MGGSALCRSATFRSSASLVLSDAKMPDFLPRQKPSSASCADQVNRESLSPGGVCVDESSLCGVIRTWQSSQARGAALVHALCAP